MNVQEYISSGIVQSYVLGLAAEAEAAEFERMCAMYPEVKDARDSFEIALEQEAMFNQLQPPANLKSKVFASIDIENDQEKFGESPAIPLPAERTSFGSKPVVRLDSKWPRYVSAAAVILLLVSTGLNFYYFNKSREISERYRDLLAQQSQMVSNNQVLQARMLEYEKAVELMKDPNMAIVKMPAIPSSPDPTASTTVYWDTVSRDVFLAVNKLPSPDADHQYQLWAMVDGKPVDAGLIDVAEGPGMVRMKNIPRAQAFAITLEKKGGSPTPTMDQLFVMGKI